MANKLQKILFNLSTMSPLALILAIVYWLEKDVKLFFKQADKTQINNSAVMLVIIILVSISFSLDVQAFVNNNLISMENSTAFVDAADTWERRKIASINDSGILQSHTAMKIKSLAQRSGVSISVSNGHIVLPADKKERHIILGFLDEEVYKGAFSETVFQTNSKRKAR